MHISNYVQKFHLQNGQILSVNKAMLKLLDFE